MVKLLDDGTFALTGDDVTHASLDALVAFHQQKPIRPYGELLTQACGQEDPAHVDYEDLFQYFAFMAEDADLPSHGPREALPPSCPARPGLQGHESSAGPSASLPTSERTASASCSPKTPFWEPLRRRLGSPLAAPAQPRGPVARAASWDCSRRPADPGAARGSPGRPQPWAGKGGDAASGKAARPASWRDAASGLRAWPGKLARALSVQAAKPEPGDLASQGWLPEEYFPPPPFAPGY